MNGTAPVQLCEWYALCTNPATVLVSHPILGSVPTCARCVRKHDMDSRVVGPVKS